jgi:hypothetical protein
MTFSIAQIFLFLDIFLEFWESGRMNSWVPIPSGNRPVKLLHRRGECFVAVTK